MKTIVEEDEIDEDNNVNYNLKPSLAKKKSRRTYQQLKFREEMEVAKLDLNAVKRKKKEAE